MVSSANRMTLVSHLTGMLFVNSENRVGKKYELCGLYAYSVLVQDIRGGYLV